MQVIMACRLSKLHDGSTGLDTQEQETVRWAEAQGHEVVAVVQDAISGAKSIMRRTRLRPWLTKPEYLSRYEGIVVYRMDRLTRGDSPSAAYAARGNLQAQHLRVVFEPVYLEMEAEWNRLSPLARLLYAKWRCGYEDHLYLARCKPEAVPATQYRWDHGDEDAT